MLYKSDQNLHSPRLPGPNPALKSTVFCSTQPDETNELVLSRLESLSLSVFSLRNLLRR